MKRNKRHLNLKGGSTKLSLFADGHNCLWRISDEIHKKATKTNQWVYQGCNMQYQYKKSIVFLYTSNEQPKQKFKNTTCDITKEIWNI